MKGLLIQIFEKLTLTCCIITFIGLNISAQEAVPATGGNASGSGGTISYSVGQAVFTTNTGTNGSVSQGVQHPYEIFVVTEIEEAKKISLEFSVFPNPTSDYLNLTLDMYNNEKLSYRLYDIGENLLQENDILG